MNVFTHVQSGSIKHYLPSCWKLERACPVNTLTGYRITSVPKKITGTSISYQPKAPQREKVHRCLVKMPSSTFQMVTLIIYGWLFQDKSHCQSGTFTSFDKRNIFYQILTFCVEIVQGNYSNSLPNQTHWVTYFLNFSFFLIFVSLMSGGKGLNVIPSLIEKDKTVIDRRIKIEFGISVTTFFTFGACVQRQLDTNHLLLTQIFPELT